MANFFIRHKDDPRTPVQHSDDIFEEYLQLNNVKNMMGRKDSGMPIILDYGFEGEAGDTKRFHFIPQNDTPGIHGQNATILGNEDSLDEYYCDLFIDVMAKAFRRKGDMTKQRIIWNFRTIGKQQLVNWFAKKNETLLFAALTGRLGDGGNQPDYASTKQLVFGDGRIISSNGGTGVTEITPANSTDSYLLGNVGAADKMSTAVLDELEYLAKKGNSKYRIAPFRLSNGQEYFKFLISLKAAKDLRQDARWQSHALSKVQAGLGAKDMIADGALGIWNNIIVESNERVETVTNAAGSLTLAHNLLLGANAAVLGWAKTTDYTEEEGDHKRFLSMAGTEIRGQRKITFDDVDIGAAQVITSSM